MRYSIYQPGKKVKLEAQGLATANLVQLMNGRTKEQVHFSLYTDAEVGFTNKSLEDKLVDSVADEDLDTDTEILTSAIRTCHHDLVPLMQRVEMPNCQLYIKNNHLQRKVNMIAGVQAPVLPTPSSFFQHPQPPRFL